MEGLGFGLIVGGIALLLYTIRSAKSEKDVRRSERIERELGRFDGRGRQFEWAHRATYRHPILMRLPGALCIVVGITLILVAAYA